jgi:hypothetical protein
MKKKTTTDAVKAEKPKTIKDMSTGQLAFQLNQHWVIITQAQQQIRQSEAAIQAINKEIESREKENSDGKANSK